MTPETPEEMQRAMRDAADRVNWLDGVRHRARARGTEAADLAGLLDYIDDLRKYIREKNEIIKAYAGPTGMTPEDVAYGLADWRPRAEAAEAEVIRLNALLEEIRAEKIER